MQRKEKLEKAVSLVNPFIKKRAEASIEELLKDLTILGSGSVNIILNYPDKEKAERFIDKVTDIILEYSEKMPAYQLTWTKNQEKIFEELQDEFPGICRLINERKRQEKFVDNFKKRIRGLERSIKDRVSAVAPEEVIEKTRLEAKNTFDFESIGEILEENNITDEDLKNEIKQEMDDAKEKTLSYIEVMEKMPPVKLYYYKTGNGGVACKININTGSYRYTRGEKRAIRRNKGEDREEYPLIISAHYLLDFLYENNIHYKNILIDPKSVKTFYMFGNYTSRNLTPGFVSNWRNHDCPDLYRCTVNKDGNSRNMLGQRLPHFYKKLIEYNYYGVYVNSEITEEEARAIAKGREHTAIYKEIQSVLEAKRTTLEELEAKLAANRAYERRIQNIIDDNRDVILDFLKNEFRDRIVSEDPLRINDAFGLDCGFLYVYTSNPGYTENARILKNSPLSSEISIGLDIQFPYNSQSLTLMRAQFNIIKEIANKYGENLYCKCVLD